MRDMQGVKDVNNVHAIDVNKFHTVGTLCMYEHNKRSKSNESDREGAAASQILSLR